jgi:hypothetical protein
MIILYQKKEIDGRNFGNCIKITKAHKQTERSIILATPAVQSKRALLVLSHKLKVLNFERQKFSGLAMQEGGKGGPSEGGLCRRTAPVKS